MKWKYILRGSLTKEICKEQNNIAYIRFCATAFSRSSQGSPIPSSHASGVYHPALYLLSQSGSLGSYLFNENKNQWLCKIRRARKQERKMRLQLKGGAEMSTPYPEAVRSTSFTSPIPKTSLYSYSGMPVAMATGWQMRFESGIWRALPIWNSTRNRWLFLAPHAANTHFREVSSLSCT